MPIAPLSAEQMAAVQARRAQEHRAAGPPPLPEMRNVDAVASLGHGDVLEFRGRRYWVPPVSYFDGAELQQLQLRIGAQSRAVHLINLQMSALAEQQETEDNVAMMDATLARFGQELDTTVALMEQAVTRFKRLVRPVGLWERMTWTWRQPFLRVDEHELMELLAFFCSRRMSHPVRHPRDRSGVTKPQLRSR